MRSPHILYAPIVSALIALTLVSCLGDNTILSLIIVLGQAHFLIAYIYANKAGKINGSYITRFLSLLVFVGPVCFFVFQNREYFSFLIFITSTLFVSHYVNDAFKLFGVEGTSNKIFAVLAIEFSFISSFITKLWQVEFFLAVILWVCGILCAGLFFYQSNIKEKEIKKLFTWFFLLPNFIVPACVVVLETISINQILGYIILFHYCYWYFFYFVKVKNSGEVLPYVDTVMWAHILIFLTFMMFLLAPQSGILYIFFHPIFFYGWTIMHILLTLRRGDYLLKWV